MTDIAHSPASGKRVASYPAKGLAVQRVYTTAGVHPYDGVTWERRDVVMTNWRDGTINFEQHGVEFPDFWSVNAANIVTTKYFRGAVGTAQRESSLRQLIDRVVLTYTAAGRDNGYFASPEDVEVFEHELSWMLLHQVFSFNSPVWFNVGTSSPQQVSACFILAVDDTMDSILNWYREEGLIFKGGSGAGLNLSRIRSSKELLSSGGTASGPVSFMRGADASAGTIKSGGATRRAAKMVVLDVDHPDIEEFIATKAREENKIRALRDAGFDMDLGGTDITSVQYQNANNSVRVNEEFMTAVENGTDFGLKARQDGRVLETVDAKKLFRSITQAAWACADPGIQYDDTINDWHTNPETGRITASNPCCFVGETLVVTDDGPIPFMLLHKAIEAGESVTVRSRDEQSGEFVSRRVTRAWVAGKADRLVEVATSLGARLLCTPEHRFLTADGWVAAEGLVAGIALVSPELPVHVLTVSEVVVDEPVTVYDLEVDGPHNFLVAGEGTPGVVVHNSEYLSLDNSSCNLASLNLMKFLNDDGTFDAVTFAKAVEIVITAMDISICFADFPTEPIGDTTRAYRQLGIGYANLGALLMATGHAYDSRGGQSLAAAITSLMTGTAYKRSAELAGIVGPYDGFARNAAPHARVMRKHAAANDEIRPLGADDAAVLKHATKAWQDCLAIGAENGWRNAQSSVLAPTGTIGFMMDCDTTGIEPDFSLVKFKKLVGGGSMQIVNQTVPRALMSLGYQDEQVEAIVEFIAEHGHVIDAPGLRPEHYEVFDCAMGERAITPMGHVRMMSAVQPFISGAISKCVVGDTLIATDDGLMRINSLHAGETEDTFRDEKLLISSLDGPRKTDAFYYGGVRPVRRIRLRSGHSVSGTDVHRLLVAGAHGASWKRLLEIEPGDYVAMQYGAQMWSSVPTSLRALTVTPPYGGQKRIDLPAEMTEELAFLLGAYAAEGHTTRANYTVTITISVQSVLERVRDAWRSEFGLEARIVEQPDRCPGVVVASKTLVEFLEALGCGSRASDKRIPDAVLRSPQRMVTAFLQGLALDAYVTTGGATKWAICLDSPLLLDDLQAVMTNLGVVHGRITKHNNVNGKDYDEVYAAGLQGQLMASIVPFLEPDKAARAATYLAMDVGPGTADVVPGITGRELYELLPAGRPGRNGVRGWRAEFAFLLDRRVRHVSRRTIERVSTLPGVVLPGWLHEVLVGNLHFSPVDIVEDAGEAEVYDLSVPVTHAFVGNGIVNHNTVNMPESATVEDVEEIYFRSWKMGIKALAIYRDNCKVGQPLSDGKATKTAAEPEVIEVNRPTRKRLPKSRPARTTSFSVGGAEGYMTASSYPDDGLGEVFLKMSKQGSTLAGLMDAFSIAISIALQYGVPLETYVSKFTNMRFDPAGMTDDPDVRLAQSVMDYIFRRLALDHLPYEKRAGLGIFTAEERIAQAAAASGTSVAEPAVIADDDEVDLDGLRSSAPVEKPVAASDLASEVAAKPAPRGVGSSVELLEAVTGKSNDAPLCMTCGVKMRPAGSCYVCEGCGSTSGCS